MSEEDLVKGISSMAGDSSAAGGDSPAGAPADDVAQPSQAELVRQFGDEFRRSMQAAIDRDGPEVFWKKVYDHMKQAMGNEW